MWMLGLINDLVSVLLDWFVNGFNSLSAGVSHRGDGYGGVGHVDVVGRCVVNRKNMDRWIISSRYWWIGRQFMVGSSCSRRRRRCHQNSENNLSILWSVTDISFAFDWRITMANFMLLVRLLWCHWMICSMVTYCFILLVPRRASGLPRSRLNFTFPFNFNQFSTNFCSNFVQILFNFPPNLVQFSIQFQPIFH